MAEVLITLMILGVIATLVIPARIERANERATVVKVKKFYANLKKAYNLAQLENGQPSSWGIDNSQQVYGQKLFDILIKPYFHIAKECKFNNNAKCVADTYSKRNGSDYTTIVTDNRFYKFTLTDGSSVVIVGSSYDRNIYPWIGTIYLDTNGIAGPNKMGTDLFKFDIVKDGIELWTSPNSFDAACSGATSTGFGCTVWVIEKGNMDYLHCNDLSWNGKQKCD